jgi:signal transduction histidine kinase
MKRGSIVQWLTLLMLGSGAVAWALSLALVLTLPAPPIMGASLSQVSGLLRSADRTNANLDRSIRPQAPIPPPSSRTTPMSPMERAIAERLSRDLEGREVRAEVSSFFLPTNSGASPPAIPDAIQDLSLITVDGQFALANPDGSWTLVEHIRPAVTGWHLQIVAAFLVFGLALVPIAFLLARRLARPLRAIASAAGSLTLGRAQSFPVPDGPKELRQVSEALSQMSRRLRGEMEERLFMLSAVAHDLRTPLTALRVRCESAEGQQRERMIGDIERMEQMIAQFLTFTGGAASPGADEVNDLAALAQEAAEDARGAGARVDFSGDRGAFVRVGAVDLRRMIGNLLDNAVRHGEHVEVAVEQAGDQIVLTVGDDGPGLPVDELERVFQPFYRPDAARGAAEGGAGLGLAIVRMMARANGGEAQLRPRHPTGLEAEVRLPGKPGWG